MKKTLRRQIIIRDCDFQPMLYKLGKTKLYDHVEIEHLTYQALQNENLILALTNKSVPTYRPLPDIGQELLFREKNLYNRKYLHWELTMDYPAGQIYVQSRINSPKEPLLRVTLEKDL